ncbi:hypothetical protein HY383_02960 [Candidatus Daviesbacteria bacterium]|nr:hypothetical protein [Candidatus Daviesbacteria bacterium]
MIRLIKKFLITFAILLALLSLFSGVAFARAGTVNYEYHIGDNFLGVVHGPTVVRASNGDTIEITGSGILSVHNKSVSGGGTFVHKDSSGNVLGNGTWTAVQLLSFKSYGNGVPQGTPEEFEGGLALIRVHLSPGFDAIMQVDCLLGNPPAGAEEGVRLAIQGVLNFNKEISGETLYVRLPS